MRDKNKIALEQLSKKTEKYKHLRDETMPPKGWIHAIRKVLGMSMRQLGERLNKTPQGVAKLEKVEARGTINIKALRDVANAMDMHLVYALIPKDGSIEDIIDKRADAVAKEIVNRTNNTMILEDQKVQDEILVQNIQNLKEELKNKRPKYLWDR